MGAIELARDGNTEPASSAARTTQSENEVLIYVPPPRRSRRPSEQTGVTCVAPPPYLPRTDATSPPALRALCSRGRAPTGSSLTRSRRAHTQSAFAPNQKA